MPVQPRTFSKAALFCAIFFAAFYLLNTPQVLFITGLGFTAWYPAAGLTVAVMLGLNPLWGFLVFFTDPLVGYLIYGVPIFSWEGALGACGATLFYGLGAYILRGAWKIDSTLPKRQDVLRYLAVVVVGAAASTSVGVLSLILDKALPIEKYWSSWLSWYTGEIIGVVGVAPFLLVHVLPSTRRFFHPRGDASRFQKSSSITVADEPLHVLETLESAAQLISIPAAEYVVLHWGKGHPLFLCFLPIIWIAMRRGIRSVVTGNVVLIMGMVVGIRLFPVDPHSMFSISATLLFMTTTGLIMGATVSEQFRQESDLREQTVYLHSLIENSPLPIVFIGLDRNMQFCNNAFLNLFQYSQEELRSTTVDKLIWPQELEARGNEMFTEVSRGRTYREATQRRRKDGALIDVELVAVPLIVDGHPRGVCWIYSDISDRIHAAQEAQQHAEQLDKMVQELQIHNTEMTLLNELNSLLQCCTSTQEAHSVVGLSASKLFPAATAGLLFAYHPDNKVLESVAQWGGAHASETTFETDFCWGLRRGRAHWSDYPGNGVVCRHIMDPVEASYLCVPMMTGKQMSGVLHLQIDRSEREREMPGFASMMEGMERLAATTAGQIALAMDGLRLKDELQTLSIRDPLTGLFNRRILEVALRREVARARRKHSHVSVVFIDLDHFKKFNDTFGHSAGDQVLIEMGRVFAGHYRTEDVVCRYGGEEFAIVMPDARPEDAVARADSLRSEAAKVVIHHGGRKLDRVTLSIGVAGFPDHGATPDDLLRLADEALYQSKALGRNRVTIAASSTASPAAISEEKPVTT